jgi:predicted glycogen debranching enzyme
MMLNRRCSDFEWLETNGLGGYASSTASFVNKRKYHGLLVCPFNPPVNRNVIVSSMDERIEGRRPDFLGYNFDPFHEFSFCSGGIYVNKRLFMPYEKNATVIEYRMDSFNERKFRFELLPMFVFRHMYALNDRSGEISIDHCENGMCVSRDADKAFVTASIAPSLEEDRKTVKAYYPLDDERKEGCYEDLFSPGSLSFSLKTPCSMSVALSLNEPCLDFGIENEKNRREAIKNGFYGFHSCRESDALNALILSADRFVVDRAGRKSVMAGYHWFADWGRDALISLPGLFLVTKRFQDARGVLMTFLDNERGGIIPNGFTEDGGVMYNSVDASLWFIDRVYRYFLYTNDNEFLKGIWDRLDSIIYSYMKGTSDIRMDSDFLIAHGDQLTWMDAVVDGKPCSPRGPKAVEVQALWYNALKVMERMAGYLEYDTEFYRKISYGVEASFERRFFNGSYFADRIGEDWVDNSLRPNQIIALSLEYVPVHRENAERAFETVSNSLLTPFGLRTLTRDDQRYVGRYRGSVVERDRAYHNGTVWPWLMGPFVTTYLKLTNYTEEARDFAYENLLMPLMLEALPSGNLEEVCSGDEPFEKGGCISQAWSVAEVLRCLCEDILLEKPAYVSKFLD